MPFLSEQNGTKGEGRGAIMPISGLQVSTFWPVQGPSAMRYAQDAECRGARNGSRVGVGQVADLLFFNEKALAD
jgi:hypothetical protein